METIEIIKMINRLNEKTIYIGSNDCDGRENEFAAYCESRGFTVIRGEIPHSDNESLDLRNRIRIFDEFLRGL